MGRGIQKPRWGFIYYRVNIENVMLTEGAARALLELYCEPLRDVLWTSKFCCRLDWADAVREHVYLIVRPRLSSVMDDASDHALRRAGARLRVALGVAQAVSSCRGYATDTNLPFWRSVVTTLWPGLTYSATSNGFVLSRTTFAHVGIEFDAYEGDGDAFWSGLLHGTPSCDAVLKAVVNKLQPDLEAALPPLRVALSRCRTEHLAPMLPTLSLATLCFLPYPLQFDAIVSLRAVRAMLRAVLAPPSRAWSTRTRLGLVVDYHVNYANASVREALDLVARIARLPRHVQLTVDRLDVHLGQLAPRWSAAPRGQNYRRALVTKVRGLGEVLRSLLVVDGAPGASTVALSGCSYGDFRLVGAALSAVAWASPPVEGLRCRALFAAIPADEQLQRLAWLAYTLDCRRRRAALTGSRPPLLALSLFPTGVAMTDDQGTYMEQLLLRGTPLRDVVGEALRLRCGGEDDLVARLTVDCLRLGSTVQLARGTRLHLEPMRVADDAVVVVTTDQQVVDAVAYLADYGGFVGVVYAGYGLVWAEAASVTTWQCLDDDVAMAEENEEADTGVGLSTLSLCFDGQHDFPRDRAPEAFRIAATVSLLACPTLHTLTIDRAVILRDDLARVLDSFPCLYALSLDRCVVESVAPLIDGYRRTTRPLRVAVLSLLDVLDVRMRVRMVQEQLLQREGHRVLLEEGEAFAPEWITELVEALCNGIARGVLCELHVDCEAMASERDEQNVVGRLAHAVASGSLPLRRLHITCRCEVLGECGRLLGPLRDVVLRDPPRVRNAVLSVLRAFHCVLPEVTDTVLAMAEGCVVRTVTWGGK
jgi:hypothetical protein